MSRIAVIICSTGRPEMLHDTVHSCLSQTFLPQRIILSIAGPGDICPESRDLPRVHVIIGRRGSCNQRNDGISKLGNDIDIVVFLDDDVELRRDYFSVISQLFQERSDVALVTGRLLADGKGNLGLSRDEAKAIIARDTAKCRSAGEPWSIMDTPSAYGCNMSVRAHLLTEVRFDERLPLYGWLEDEDFSVQCSRFGRVVLSEEARLVHLRTIGGRVSGRQFGFSQFMNSYYLWRKGGLVIPFYSLLYKFWLRALIANMVGSILPQGLIDRRGRLLGNLEALYYIVRGEINPERILMMK